MLLAGFAVMYEYISRSRCLRCGSFRVHIQIQDPSFDMLCIQVLCIAETLHAEEADLGIAQGWIDFMINRYSGRKLIFIYRLKRCAGSSALKNRLLRCTIMVIWVRPEFVCCAVQIFF